MISTAGSRALGRARNDTACSARRQRHPPCFLLVDGDLGDVNGFNRYISHWATAPLLDVGLACSNRIDHIQPDHSTEHGTAPVAAAGIEALIVNMVDVELSRGAWAGDVCVLRAATPRNLAMSAFLFATKPKPLNLTDVTRAARTNCMAAP